MSVCTNRSKANRPCDEEIPCTPCILHKLCEFSGSLYAGPPSQLSLGQESRQSTSPPARKGYLGSMSLGRPDAMRNSWTVPVTVPNACNDTPFIQEKSQKLQSDAIRTATGSNGKYNRSDCDEGKRKVAAYEVRICQILFDKYGNAVESLPEPVHGFNISLPQSKQKKAAHDLRIRQIFFDVDRYGNAVEVDQYGNAVEIDRYGNAVEADWYGNAVEAERYGNLVEGMTKLVPGPVRSDHSSKISEPSRNSFVASTMPMEQGRLVSESPHEHRMRCTATPARQTVTPPPKTTATLDKASYENNHNRGQSGTTPLPQHQIADLAGPSDFIDSPLGESWLSIPSAAPHIPLSSTVSVNPIQTDSYTPLSQDKVAIPDEVRDQNSGQPSTTTPHSHLPIATQAGPRNPADAYSRGVLERENDNGVFHQKIDLAKQYWIGLDRFYAFSAYPLGDASVLVKLVTWFAVNAVTARGGPDRVTREGKWGDVLEDVARVLGPTGPNSMTPENLKEFYMRRVSRYVRQLTYIPTRYAPHCCAGTMTHVAERHLRFLRHMLTFSSHL